MATFITLMESRRNVVDQLFQKQRLDDKYYAIKALRILSFTCF